MDLVNGSRGTGNLAIALKAVKWVPRREIDRRLRHYYRGSNVLQYVFPHRLPHMHYSDYGPTAVHAREDDRPARRLRFK